ncbi:MAG: cell elongation specific D,D-transpeptidase, penicillin-binding protein 2 [Candidatus Gottesmanbacteria bacterium GW2011_GWA2_43_14]|uniref:Cell elongation specific D,D-transpeptidase, penicillin-binding protein 2 n=1 Tax=Candidatus Gottesmanbacteria bacterium GW2011_GWA2_43_14 TaxID=1618443 RepID=A0A0G1DCN4_9BACT|nr:MAG: cell elongation specific D,D-transpeptidase, penicillin-binding protein 2 [Candidatus Gottesmanbacteria bacterium GW2011_GWA2_43_14]
MSQDQLGNIFGESITGFSRHSKVRLHPDAGGGSHSGRLYFFIFLAIFGLGILSLRLFSLTLIEGSGFRRLSQENRIRETVNPAPRGIIYDRNGIALVRNIPVFLSPEGDVFYNRKESDGDFIIESSTREYIYGPLMAPVLGYVGEVGPEELEKIPPLDAQNTEVYKIKDTVGKMGIEKVYDSRLRGTDGKEMFEVDATGKYVRTLGRIDPRVGQNLDLTLDFNLQQTAWEMLKDKKGAVVVSEPETGAVLALFSEKALPISPLQALLPAGSARGKQSKIPVY